MSEQAKIHGALAEFDGPQALIDAAGKMRKEGFSKWDTHSPFPIHGMDDAMGEKRSPLGWFVSAAAFTGFALALYFQYWTSAVDYPLIIAGKTYFSYMAFFPITFALTVLFSVLTTVGGMVVLIKHAFYHPVFYSNNFAKASDDGFFVSVMADDPKFDASATSDFLTSIGGTNVELLQEVEG